MFVALLMRLVYFMAFVIKLGLQHAQPTVLSPDAYANKQSGRPQKKEINIYKMETLFNYNLRFDLPTQFRISLGIKLA